MESTKKSDYINALWRKKLFLKFASIYVHPSLCNEEIHIFIASEFEEYSPILDKSESDLTIKKVTVSELKELLLNNEIPAAPDGYMLSLYLLKINEI